MTSTTFVDGQTVVVASWLNDVNAAVYTGTWPVTSIVPVTNGGTGASTAAGARTNLGLGTLATQNGTFSGTSSGTNTGDQNLFRTIAVSGQSDVVADTTTDTLTLVAGTNVTITTDAVTDSITINASGGGGGTPGGSNTQIQYNNAGAFGGDSGLTTNGSGTIGLSGTINGTSIPTSKTLVVTTDIGTTVQAQSAQLTSIAGVANGIVAHTAANTFTPRTITGTANLITVTNGDGVSGNPTLTVGSNVYQVGGTDVAVTDGGTGVSTMTTAYAPVCAGTTATGALQVASTGLSTSGFVLTSTGASSLPSFQALPSSGNWVKLSSDSMSASAGITRATAFTSTYVAYCVVLSNVFTNAGSQLIQMQFSTNGSSLAAGTAYTTQTVTATGATITGSVSASQAGIFLSPIVGTTAITGFSGVFYVLNSIATTGYYKLVGMGNLSVSSTSVTMTNIAAHFNTTGTALTGWGILPNAGTLTGVVTMYGLTA